MCGFFSVAAELCILSSCWGWGRLLLSLFWCDSSAIFLGHLRFSAMCHAAGYPSGVPHLADSGWLASSCSGGFTWGWGCLATDVLLPHFGFLPCASAAPTSAASPSGFCALAWCVSMSDSSLLVYSWGCAGGIFAVPLGFSTMCRALPQGLQRALLSRMQVQLEFSGHRVSVLLLRLVWVRTAVQPSHGSVLSFTLDSSSLAWLRGEPSTVFLLLCLPSGCGHPLGSLVSFVTIARQRRWPLEGFFFCVVDSRLGVLS